MESKFINLEGEIIDGLKSSLLSNKNNKQFRYIEVELFYPDGSTDVVDSILWEDKRLKQENKFEIGSKVIIRVQVGGKYDGYSIIKELSQKKTSVLTGSIFDVILPITNENNFYYSNVTYKKLLTLKELHAIKYADLLQCLEWKIKRFEILLRDNNTCQKCLKTITIKVETSTNQKTYLVELNNQNASSEEHLNLHVHHKLYIFNRLPWNYDSKYLITLCNSCHETVHLNKVIPVYNEKGIKIDEFGKCNRCNGIGYLPVYKKISNGVCFKCWGDGYNSRIINF